MTKFFEKLKELFSDKSKEELEQVQTILKNPKLLNQIAMEVFKQNVNKSNYIG